MGSAARTLVETMRCYRLRATILALVLVSCRRPGTAPAPEPRAYLFSYFTRNGEDGVHLAWNRDGISWVPVNRGRSIIKPVITGAGHG